MREHAVSICGMEIKTQEAKTQKKKTNMELWDL
jgi:hypothetical protein